MSKKRPLTLNDLDDAIPDRFIVVPARLMKAAKAHFGPSVKVIRQRIRGLK